MTKEAALARLTERQQTLIRLRDDQKLTWKQVATEVGLSPNYATILWKEAKAALRRWEATQEQTVCDTDPRLEFDPMKYAGDIIPPSPPEPAKDGVREVVFKSTTFPAWGNKTPPDPLPAPAPASVVVTGVVQDPPKVQWVVGVPVPAQG